MRLFSGLEDQTANLLTIMSKPGLAMQKLTTKEPTADMAEVAIRAVEAVFDWKAYLKEEFDLDIPYETEETENTDMIPSEKRNEHTKRKWTWKKPGWMPGSLEFKTGINRAILFCTWR